MNGEEMLLMIIYGKWLGSTDEVGELLIIAQETIGNLTIHNASVEKIKNIVYGKIQEVRAQKEAEGICNLSEEDLLEIWVDGNGDSRESIAVITAYYQYLRAPSRI
jgi:hypothetical protein